MDKKRFPWLDQNILNMHTLSCQRWQKSNWSSTSICTCLIFTQKFLTAPTSFTMWSGWLSFKTNLSESHTAEWIIFAITRISVCSPLFKTHFTTVMLDSFLWLMTGSSSTNRSPFPSFFLDLVWQMMLPSPTALFQQGTMVLQMTVVPPASSFDI